MSSEQKVNQLDIVSLWEQKNPPTIVQMADSIDLTDIKKVPEWSSRVSLLAKRNMVNYFLSKERKTAPWFFFIYAKCFRLSFLTVRKVLESYTENLDFGYNSYFPNGTDNYSGEFQQLHIDPRYWFGPLTQLKKLPSFYCQILKERFTNLKQKYPEGTVFKVSSTGRVECQLPKNFHIELIKHLHSLKMFTECYETAPEVKDSPFSKDLGDTNVQELAKLLDEDDSCYYF